MHMIIHIMNVLEVICTFTDDDCLVEMVSDPRWDVPPDSTPDPLDSIPECGGAGDPWELAGLPNLELEPDDGLVTLDFEPPVFNDFATFLPPDLSTADTLPFPLPDTTAASFAFFLGWSRLVIRRSSEGS